MSLENYVTQQLSKLLIPATGAMDISSKQVAEGLLRIGSKTWWLKFHSLGLFMMGTGTLLFGAGVFIGGISLYRSEKIFKRWI
jgi:hypothetical protein